MGANDRVKCGSLGRPTDGVDKYSQVWRENCENCFQQ